MKNAPRRNAIKAFPLLFGIAATASCLGQAGMRGALRNADEAGLAYHASYTRAALGRTTYWYRSKVVEPSRTGTERCERDAVPKLSLALAGYEATQPGLCDDVLAYLSRAQTLYGGGLEVRYDLTLVGEPGAYQSEVYRFGGGPIIVALSMPNRHPVEYDSVHSLPATAFHEMKHVTWALGGVTSGASEGETALEELSVQLLTHCANGAHGGRIAFAFDPAADQARVRRDLADLVRNKQPNAETFDLLYREGAAFLLREAGVPSQGGADWLARTCRTVTADPYALRGVIGDLLGRNV